MQKSVPAYGAVDIGGTKTAAGFVSPEGQVLAREEFPTNTSNPLPTIESITKSLREQRSAHALNLLGLGVGCTGPIDPLRGTVGDVALLPGWKDYPLRASLEQAFLVPAAIENDCDAAAIAQSIWGPGAGINRLLYVSLSTGIGAGLVIDGQLYRGADGVHPEIGHMTIEADGPQCYCGATGCWESLVSGSALAQRYNLDAAQLFELAQTGDPKAKAAVRQFTVRLGIGLGNLVTLFSPEKIVLGGGLMRSAKLFLAEAVSIAMQRSRLIPASTVSIVAANSVNDAGLIGAAAAAHLYLHAEQMNPCKPH